MSSNETVRRKIGVHAAPFSQAIHAGVLNKAGTEFVSGYPVDVTDIALHSVGEYTRKHYDGHVLFTFDKFTVEVIVEDRKQEADDD